MLLKEPSRLMSNTSELWYFAYGANMDRETLVTRRKIVPGKVEPACLEGYELVFDQAGIPLIEPSFANLKSAAGACVHGVAYALSAKQLEELDALEGGGAYDHIEVDLQLASGAVVSGVSYVTDDRVEGRLPSQRYMSLLLRGAREQGLPADWLARLEEQRTAPLSWASFFAPVIMVAFEFVFRLRLAMQRILGR